MHWDPMHQQYTSAGVYIYVYIHTYTLALIYTYMWIHSHSYICLCTHSHSNTAHAYAHVYTLSDVQMNNMSHVEDHLRRANEHAHMYTFALIYEPCIYTDLTHSTNTVDLERVLQGMLQCMLQCVCLRLCCSCRRTLHAATISSILAGRKQSSKEAGIATHIFLQKSNFAPTFSSKFSSEWLLRILPADSRVVKLTEQLRTDSRVCV